MDGSGASDGWKTGRELKLHYTGMVDRAITGLQDYTLFFEPRVSKTAYLYYIFI